MEICGRCSPETGLEDPQSIQYVREQLDNGNDWAWCCVGVVCTYGNFKASTTLGGCSYKNETDFRNSEYYLDMVDECIVDLNRQIEEVFLKGTHSDTGKAYTIHETRSAIARGVGMMLCDWLTVGPIGKAEIAKLCDWIRNSNLEGLK